MSQESQEQSFNDRVAELVRDMLEQVDQSLIKLSAAEWREIHRILKGKRSFLENEGDLNESELERTGRLVQAAFLRSKTLRSRFSTPLGKLQRGMKLAGVGITMPEKRRQIVKNKEVLLTLSKRAEKEISKKNTS